MLLGRYTIKGKVISKDQLPIKGLVVHAYDDDPLLNLDAFLGDSVTDSNGSFRIDFDESKFEALLESLVQTPDVYILIKDAQGNSVLNYSKSRVARTEHEIEYHVRLIDDIPDPESANIYDGNSRRMISMLNNYGNEISIENQIYLGFLKNGDLPVVVKDKLQNFVSRFEDRINNFDHFLVILSSVLNSVFEESRIQKIGYDGPQVPRLPRRGGYDHVVIWPREEEFKWE